MKLLTLLFIFTGLNAQASLYCALGTQTPSEVTSHGAIPYATLQIDFISPTEVQAYVTDYYHDETSTSQLQFTGEAMEQIDGIEMGSYVDKATDKKSELKGEAGQILFVLDGRNYTCEIL